MRFLIRAPDGREITLHDRLQWILMDTLVTMGEVGGVSIGRIPKELTSTAAAELLSVSRTTLMKWVKEGRVSGHKVGSHTRFNREDVFALRAVRAAERQAAFAALRDDDDLDWA